MRPLAVELKHFGADEFNCPCGKCGMGIGGMNAEFLCHLDKARAFANTPFVLNSAIRCADHNRAVGGVADSSHTKGLGVDIEASNSRARWQILEALIKIGFDRIGIGSDFIHVDADPDKDGYVVWLYD